LINDLATGDIAAEQLNLAR